MVPSLSVDLSSKDTVRPEVEKLKFAVGDWFDVPPDGVIESLLPVDVTWNKLTVTRPSESAVTVPDATTLSSLALRFCGVRQPSQ